MPKYHKTGSTQAVHATTCQTSSNDACGSNVFKSVFLGVLDHGSIVVSSIPEDLKEDIQILQNNALRCCMNIIDPRSFIGLLMLLFITIE